MKWSLLMFKLAIIGVLTSMVVITASANDNDAVRQRMAQRLEVVSQLKRAKVVGENNRGYLEFLHPETQSHKEIVAAENADRRLVYEAIARRTDGATAETVGQVRARSIAEQSAAGIMVQTAAGQWRETVAKQPQ